MEKYVTVIAPDNMVYVDGVALKFDFAIDEDVHAIQWRDNTGHIEYTDGRLNKTLTADDYEKDVLPFVTLWENEKARLDQKVAEALAEYNSPKARAERIREERDLKLAACDYLMMPDYPLGEAERATWLAYRQALRDMPQAEGFPWQGVGDAPWPEEPEA